MELPRIEAALPYVAGGAAVSLAGSYIFLRSITPNVLRDLKFSTRLVRVAKNIRNISTAKITISDVLHKVVDENPKSVAIEFIESKSTRAYTWSQFDHEANKVANWALSEGVQKGDVVALLVDNRPEFLFYLFGLLKVGATVSLINTALIGSPLKYSLETCNAKCFFIGIEHTKSVNEIRDENLNANKKWYSISGDAENFVRLDSVVLQQKTSRPSRSVRKGMNMNSPAIYIYTSGTTGNPKPSIIKHARLYSSGLFFTFSLDTTKQDKIYCPLPLFHSSALLIGFGQSLATGATFVFRKKFSATAYFKDCQNHGCTIGQYIGELCRFLLNSPPQPTDKTHKVRGLVGNGLRPEVWGPFQKRFGIDVIYEFYASTEGNATLLNHFGKEGAVGWVSPLVKFLHPARLVKFDQETETPVRAKNGFCIECKPNEAGELLGCIEQGDPSREFSGYTDPKATEKKILRNVFVKGDSYFRTGDLLRYDQEGYWYFVDRIGDTFRWKGENVATSEVAQVISGVAGVKDANVYGVAIPNKDGRAGMASLNIDPAQFSLDALYAHCSKNLPKYATPVFVRLQEEMEITSTFKHRKVELVKEGYDPELIKDPIYFREDAEGKFVRLDKPLFDKINNNQVSRL
eukprot:TRINITY_DN1719_c0_g1_i1.p1 TRINITY_DN1719_c0_g1~~TRINITY_DN1719_c0_g1_i1.p1  ORF type:complete len:632 (+),score=105.20 TRINITY_DN1719_c0_g1_i1:40-1935(+)